MIEVVYVPVEANSEQYMDYLENKLNNGYNVVRADSCNNAIMYIIEKKDNRLSEKETIQIEKDRSLEFNIGDYITFDKYIERPYDFRRLNTLYRVLGYNKPNNIKVKIIKDRDRESGKIASINLLTEYPYITKLYDAVTESYVKE